MTEEGKLQERLEAHTKAVKNSKLRGALRDIDLLINWRHIANDYFEKSVPWFYQRLNEVDGRGNPCAFTPEEKQQLRGALFDVADRIRRAADNIS